jgi:hypothetical protein
MKLVATLTDKELPDPDHWTPQMTSQYSMELGDAMIGKNEAYLKFVFHAEGAEDAAFLISQNVKTRWPKQSGYLGKTNLTRKDTRTLQLWLQERSVCERLLRYYREAGGEDAAWKEAKALYDEGRYASARRLLGSAMSVLQYRGEGRTKTVLYSGDVGRFDKVIIKDPTLDFAPEHRDVDLLIMESTYGTRLHDPVVAMKPMLKKVLLENTGNKALVDDEDH